MTGKLARSFLALAVATASLGVLVLPAQAQQLDAKRAQATELESKIAAQGDKLDIADEEYNQAQIASDRVSADAANEKALVQAAEIRYGILKARLAKRARLLYMNPSAPIDAFLGAKTFSEMERGHVLGAAVLTADTTLVMRTEKAREEVIARSNQLDRLQADASSKAEALNGRRTAVAGELSAQRALLAGVKGDIAKILAQQQAQQLAQAKTALQRSTQSSSGGSSPVLAPQGPQQQDEAASPPPPVSSGAGKALAVAQAQIGKPYQWAAAGPDSFDCSGLTMYAWAAAGVSMVHSAAAQYDEFPHVSQAELQPGDLVFFGSPIHHVGIYEGGGIMIDAPQTGEFVRRDSIARSDYAGASRP